MNRSPTFNAWKGKGKVGGKEPGKGAYEIHQDEQQYEDFDVQDQEEPPLHGFGGGEIDEIELPWTHVVRRARSSTDMRPMRWKPKTNMCANTCVDNSIETVERAKPKTIGAVQSLIEG